MILKDHNVIFIHVQKTAGTTIHNLFKFSVGVGSYSTPCGMHYRLADLLKKEPHIDLNKYEVITVKRNPWERFASFYLDTFRDYVLGRVPNKPIPWKKYFTGLTRVDDMVDKLFVNGALPPNITIFNFNNLQNEFCPWWKERFGYTLVSLPHHNRKPEQRYNDLKTEMLMDPQFQEVISNLCHREIDYFKWKVQDLPTGTQ